MLSHANIINILFFNRQRNISDIDKVFVKTGKYNVECIRRTEFVTNEAWMKFIKYINYNRYFHKQNMAQKSRMQKKLVTMDTVV